MARSSPNSLRQLMLQHLQALPDDEHSCTHCLQRFSAKSDSAAWKNHFVNKHSGDGVWRAIQAQYTAANSKRPASVTINDHAEIQSIAAEFQPAAASVSSVSSISSQPAKKQKVVQPSISASLLIGSSKHALPSLAHWLASHSIAYSAVQSDEFHEFLRGVGWRGAMPSREAIKRSTQTQAATMREQLSLRLHSAVTSIAADGWTNVKQQKITNVVPIANGVAYYWCSIVNADERNTAEWLAEQLLAVINTLITQHHARVIAFVVDNEAVNRKTHRLLKQQLPFLIHVPCAAHTVQLIVRSCLKNEACSDTLKQLHDLIHYFDVKDNRHALRRMQQARSSTPLAVLKPCDTRWSSMLVAAQRLLRMKKDIVCCFDGDSLPSVSADFWERLAALVEFLKPFQVATDCIQRDTATLYTVYEQFAVLLRHVKEKAQWAAVSVLERWSEHINIDAVVACAILSFATPDSALSIQAAQRFIVSFGSAYLSFYQLRDESKEQLADALTMQIADFNGREGEFIELKQHIATMKRATTTGLENTQWNPRKVWLLYPQNPLAAVATALLSVSASEAAVERTFSAQGLVHSKLRNALHSTSIEAEMFVKFNSRQLKAMPAASTFGMCREIRDDATSDEEELFATPDDESVAATEIDEERKHSDDEEMVDAPAAAAAAAAPAPPAPTRRQLLLRQSSMAVMFDDVKEFLQYFIQKYAVTSVSNETIRLLEARSPQLRRCPHTSNLVQLLREALGS